MTDPTRLDPKAWLIDPETRTFWGKVLDDPKFRTVLTTAISHCVMAGACTTPAHVDGARGMAETLLGLLDAVEGGNVTPKYEYPDSSTRDESVL